MITLLVVDDQAVVRAGLSVIAGAQPDIEVVGEAADGAEAIRLARELQPDVVSMDLRMPGLGGIEATRAIAADPAISSEVLVVTTFDVDDDVFAALEAGAAGFILKGAEEDRLLGAIRSVAAGEGTLDQRLTRRVLREFTSRRAGGRPVPPPSGSHPLTDRELEVLRLLAEGLSNAEISARLFIEPTTVKYHLAGLLQKTAARDRLQAVLWGIRTGLVEVGG
ncbi:response regulator [Homoserinibacter sp. YIM 151385]|uniref:response regulator n=1 Tax=Homoserinibacter sp. YIM 151385 TaxID=2985506 RepID=UPI0022F0A0B2|nr:response regulator transcription factor [Homoserinibacter sp. YIM 151385]WBU37042.1 response regulator transcription factor [Homoserinibacter sp. YIM 151385]